MRLGVHPAMALIEEVDEQLGELMRRFQRNVLDAPALLQDYRALIERHGRRTLERWLRAAIDKRLEIERADACAALADAVEPASRRWADCASLSHPLQRIAKDAALRRQIGATIRQLQARAGKLGQDAAAKLASALDTEDGAAAFVLARDALFTREGTPRKLGDLMEVSFAVDALHRLTEQAAQQDAHDDHARMVRLSRVLLEDWRTLKRERALIDMQDLERCALQMLSDAAIAGWLQQRLDARLRHVLIDEFQDTSTLQWQALPAGCRRMPAQGVARADSGRCRVHRRRSQAEHLPLSRAPSRVCSRRRASSSSRAWKAMTWRATTRGATRPRWCRR